jgi:glucuronate isomerase
VANGCQPGHPLATIGHVLASGRRLAPHPDRLLPPDPSVRPIARELYDRVRAAPIVSPHGHVDPKVLLADEPFPDPASLFVTPDHYVTRLLHAHGVPLDALGVGRGRLTEAQARTAWRAFCAHWDAYRGTPVRYWLEQELAELFDVPATPSGGTADELYDHIAGRLQQPEYRPRRLFARFGISVLATTDDPADDLAAHAALAADSGFAGRVIPSFRPDRYLEPGPGWADRLSALATAAGVDTGDYAGYLAALERRRRYFVEHGATSADHSHLDVGSEPLTDAEAERIFRAARAGEATVAEAVAFRRHMLFQMARMSVDDGLVMTLHPGVCRDHHSDTAQRYGADTGSDIPVPVEFTRPLRPLLQAFGTAAGFHLVLFTLDETTFSREIAPLAGFYPAVYAGAPWWFLDAPEAILRYRGTVTETAGFGKTSGFIDDTRAFCSIPARHDMSRRLDAAYLARLVAEHRLGPDEAGELAEQLVDAIPRAVFKL